MASSTAIAGVGVGLRNQHFNTIINDRPQVPWFEVLADDYFDGGGLLLPKLLKVRESYPLTLHAVSLSLGSEQVSQRTIEKLNWLSSILEPSWVSDHLCWTNLPPYQHHDLLPLPYTDECLDRLVSNIHYAQEQLQRPLIIENVSSYLNYNDSLYSEAEFLATLCQRTGCKLLLDINNIAVSAYNHQYAATEYLNLIPKWCVQQFHLAGYSDEVIKDTKNSYSYRLDSHSEPVHDDVWHLYKNALTRFGSIPTIVEWDNKIPTFARLQNEATMAAKLMHEATLAAASLNQQMENICE